MNDTRAMHPRTTGEAIESWNGEQLEVIHDPPSGAWIIIAVHSTAAGPARGGTRIFPYRSLDDAILDVLALSRAMTAKFRALHFPSGGGKAVVFGATDLSPDARKQLLIRYGSMIAALGGRFATGPDIGTSPEDMNTIAVHGAPYVFCRTPEHGGAGDSAPLTAIGVLTAVLDMSQRIFGSEALHGRTIALQGLGSVGLQLAQRLLDRGASLVVADLDPQRQQTLAHPDVCWVEPEQLLATTCDILVPCAVGGVLTKTTIPQLRCRGVVGAANNIFADPGAAPCLAARGISLAPDFLANAGGAVGITGIETLGWTAKQAEKEVASRIRRALAETYAYATKRGLDPQSAALELQM